MEKVEIDDLTFEKITHGNLKCKSKPYSGNVPIKWGKIGQLSKEIQKRIKNNLAKINAK